MSEEKQPKNIFEDLSRNVLDGCEQIKVDVESLVTMARKGAVLIISRKDKEPLALKLEEQFDDPDDFITEIANAVDDCWEELE